MSTCAQEIVPSHCYCQVQNKKVSLNDIAKIITALNIKTLQLRNEVNAFKNVNTNVEKKLSEKCENTREQSPPRYYDECPDIFRSNAKLDRLPEVPAPFTHCFQNSSLKKREMRQQSVDNAALKKSVKVVDLSAEGKLNQNEIQNDRNCDRVYNDLPKIRMKKISRNVQCDLLMDRKRRRFLDCFRIKPFVKECKLKANQRVKNSAKVKNYVVCNSRINRLELLNDDMSDKTQLRRYEGCQIFDPTHEHGRTIDQIFESSQIRSMRGKNTSNQFTRLQENKVSKTELDGHEGTLHKDAENEHRTFECSITGRMGGGAEFRGCRLISDLNDKIQKINTYKHIKFDARNVKRRLDACIAELNEIIEDVSLIFPDTDIAEE